MGSEFAQIPTILLGSARNMWGRVKYLRNNAQSRTWHPRQQNSFALGQMVYVGPTAGEKIYLRMLLMVVKRPRLFDDLKYVNGELCETFHKACLKHGLLEDDGEWEMCL